MSKTPCQLYLITPPIIPDLDKFVDQFAHAVQADIVACAQLRLKSEGDAPSDDDAVLRAAEKLLPIARAADVAFLINDRPDLAQKSGADGVHVGQGDASCRDARALLGEEASIGVTCHDSIDLGFHAGEDGADYAAFGAFFPSGTKQASYRPDPEILTKWAEATVLPSVAIGGITPENCGGLVRAGADFLAVAGAIWGHEEGPAAAVSSFARAIEAAH